MAMPVREWCVFGEGAKRSVVTKRMPAITARVPRATRNPTIILSLVLVLILYSVGCSPLISMKCVCASAIFLGKRCERFLVWMILWLCSSFFSMDVLSVFGGRSWTSSAQVFSIYSVVFLLIIFKYLLCCGSNFQSKNSGSKSWCELSGSDTQSWFKRMQSCLKGRWRVKYSPLVLDCLRKMLLLRVAAEQYIDNLLGWLILCSGIIKSHPRIWGS